MGDDGYAAARRTTINAHYTDPAYVQAVWATAAHLGFEGGTVLEPGAGAGAFLDHAPASAHVTGVEVDATSAQIAALLHPESTIRVESFARTPLPDVSFDLTVGNVPFGDVRLHDPRHNHGRHSLHNHFLIKALALTRAGGLAILLTSHWTLDSRNPAARRELHAMADLVGAVRLPTGAHRALAGTDVVTDLLILRRRPEEEEPAPFDWETTRVVEVPGGQLRVNDRLADRPDLVLGELRTTSSQYSDAALSVSADLSRTPAELQQALDRVAGEAHRNGLAFAAPSATVGPSGPAAVAPPAGRWDGHLTAHPDGRFSVQSGGIDLPLTVPKTQTRELRALLGLRDRAVDLLAAEAASLADTPAIDALRTDLVADYIAYTRRHGPINRFAQRPTGRVDPATGQPRLARVTPRVMATLRQDPFASLVSALEVFDEATQTAEPATLLRERVVLPRRPVLGVETADEALHVCLEQHGSVDLERIAGLLGIEAREARQQLGERVYNDPVTGVLVPAPEYLSGDVRRKLDIAQIASATRPELQSNAAALRRVLPDDLGAEDIEARLGAAWIDAPTHRAFLVEVLEDDSVQVEHAGGAIWEVRAQQHSVAATSTWGTARLPAGAIVKATLEQRAVQVTDDAGDGRRVLNPVETAAAQEKATALQERFAEWVWEDPDRAARLLTDYNRRFNSIVLRDYTADGERLTLPGLARTFQPRRHQRTAVARMLAEPAVGLFHQVGAGKTAEMVMGAMELRRLGMASKPAVVVPNHMLEQFSREWLQLYPQARLLAASSVDLAGDKRRAFVARAATSDWDAVLMTRSAFERLPLSEDAQVAYVQREVGALRSMLDRARQQNGLTVKRLEKLVLSAEQRLEDRLDGPRDPGITFEQTGIDYLIVDEVHDYKNLRTPSNIRDAAIDGSKRATDLHMKLELLREQHGHRVVTAATATPIANSITEAHVMGRFLRPDLLDQAGVADFDAWAATFGRTVTEIEMAPTGGGNYRMQTRFARFQNVPEMLRMWHVFADVKTAEDLDLPTPALRARADAKRLPETVVISPTQPVADYVADLGARAEAVRARAVTPEEDNMLKISTDGRKAALDLRLVDPAAPAALGATKLDVAADHIAALHHRHAADRFVDPQSREHHPAPGALQIVFCDLGTPSDGWNVYEELREQLAARDVPRHQIRFMHEAHNDAEKARLFAAARSGQVSVLLGSTQKMGVGTNIQARAVALHHLDCPWRPADVEQRDGRILRQGNQNAEVGIYRYVVEGSFDGYSWQTVERKARFIAQVMRGRLDARSIEDIGDSALSFAEVKALASGDPLILEKAQADAELTRLQRLKRAHTRDGAAVAVTLSRARDTVARCELELPAIRAAQERHVDTRGDKFAMRVDGQVTRRRADAAQALEAAITHRARGGLGYGQHVRDLGEIAELAGQRLEAKLRHTGGRTPTVELTITGLTIAPATTATDRLPEAGGSLVRQLEHRVSELDAHRKSLQSELEHAAEEARRAAARAEQPFKHHDALVDAQSRVAEITAAMTERQQQPDTPNPEPPAPEMARLPQPRSPGAQR